MAKRSQASRERALGVDTRPQVQGVGAARGAVEDSIALTILSHPDSSRVGDVARFEALARTGGEVQLARMSPDFSKPEGSDGWPLADPFISRKPAILRSAAGGGISITRDKDAIQISADGEIINDSRSFAASDLEHGVVLELGQRVALLMHRLKGQADRAPHHGLVGENPGMNELRGNITRVAVLDVPVLLRGETGTGKELVAQAIHAASARNKKPCLSVNMAAISPTVATSELFGHTKGAFTGAVDDHPGYFVRANGGTLFLDEIGEAPVEVQTMLLRTLETGVVQPVGGRTETPVDVRLIAATDANLEDLVRAGKFRSALLHRLAGYEIHIPPLRERRDDIGRLFYHFVRDELERTGSADRLDEGEGDPTPWIPAALVARLARYDFPGNVRQLRNVARQLVISSRDAPVMQADRSVERLLMETPNVHSQDLIVPAAISAGAPGASGGAGSGKADPSIGRRKPSEVSEDELLEALRSNRFRIEPTANTLRISRASLYMLIEKSTRLRKAKDIPPDELLRVHAETNGDVDLMAEKLEVSGRGLYLRLKELLDKNR